VHFRTGTSDAGTRPFDGLIDEFALYGTVLDATAVKAHYDAGVVPEPSTLTLCALGLLAYRRRRR